MPWVERIPRRPDFCGCPPCGLCYVWQDNASDEIIEAVDKMLQDLLGKGALATPEQRATVEAAVKKIHEDNVRRNAESTEPPSLDAGAAAFTEADNKRRLEMQLNYAAKLRARAAQYKPVVRQPTLDEIGIDEAMLKRIDAERQRDLAKEREAAEAKVKAAQEAFNEVRRKELSQAMRDVPEWQKTVIDNLKVWQPIENIKYKNDLMYEAARNALYGRQVSPTNAIPAPTVTASVPISQSATAKMMNDGTMEIVTVLGGRVTFKTAEEALAHIVKYIEPNFANTFRQFKEERLLKSYNNVDFSKEPVIPGMERKK